jgi:hypothetical protein
MSKSEDKRISVMKGLGLPSGKINDLDDSGVTMHYLDKTCPKGHIMSASGRRYYCYECGVYWNLPIQ